MYWTLALIKCSYTEIGCNKLGALIEHWTILYQYLFLLRPFDFFLCYVGIYMLLIAMFIIIIIVLVHLSLEMSKKY